jgi:hypothetical protein
MFDVQQYSHYAISVTVSISYAAMSKFISSNLAQDRDKYWAFVNRVMSLWVP